MLDAQGLSRAVRHIYASLLDADAERIWLDQLRLLVGAEHACLNMVGTSVDWWSCSRFGSAERAIGDRFVQDAAYSASLAQLPALAPTRLSQYVETGALRRTDMYQELIRPMHGGIAAVYTWRGSCLNAITVCRNAEHDRDFSDAELALLQPLLEHIRNAWKIRRRFDVLRASRDAALAVIDTMADAVVIVDRAQRVLHLNPAAEVLLAERDALRLEGRLLCAARSDDQRVLQRLLEDAWLAAAALGGASSGDAVPVPRSRPTCAIARPLPRRPLLLSAVPAACLGSWRMPRPLANAVALFLRDPDRRAVPDIGVVREALGLTRREAELALALQAGDPLSAAAVRIGITEGTARQYLKSVFAKTGVERQSELAVLLRNLA